MFDVDAVWTNQSCEPLVMFEEKSPFVARIDVQNEQQFKLMRNIANRCGVPFFAVVPYFIAGGEVLGPEVVLVEREFPGLDTIQVLLAPANELARALLPQPRMYSERGFVAIEAYLRGTDANSALLARCHNRIIEVRRPAIEIPAVFLTR